MKKIFKLANLDSATAAAKIEKAIKKIEGVNDASVNFTAERMVLDLDFRDYDMVVKNVVRMCRKLEPDCIIEN